MKAAGVLLSRPAAYRAAVTAADAALAHLPRFVIYNGLNAWGKHREVPHPPEQTFHSWYHANRNNLHRMGGVFLDPPTSADTLAPVRAKIADAKVVCSTVPEIAGNRDIAGAVAPR